MRYLTKIGRRVAALLLLTVGLVVTLGAWFYLSGVIFGLWMVSLIASCYYIMIVSYVVAPRASMWILRCHQCLASRYFQKSIDVSVFSLRAVVGANLMLNFTFFTIVCLLSFRDLLGLVPVKLVEGVISPSSPLLLWSLLNFIFDAIFATFPGPALVFGVRWLRKKSAKRGERMFEFLQVLFYVALFLPVLIWPGGIAPSGMNLEGYARMMMYFFLPGNIGGIGLSMLLESARISRPS